MEPLDVFSLIIDWNCYVIILNFLYETLIFMEICFVFFLLWNNDLCVIIKMNRNKIRYTNKKNDNNVSFI